MKILTKEEERDHYNAALTGGLLGGVTGVGAGLLAVFVASKRYPAFRELTLPLRAFLVTSSATFASIVTADSYSRAYERERHPERQYVDQERTIEEQARALRSTRQKTMDWLNENRYGVVFGSWVASMGTALGLVGRNPYLTGQQKLVQARVYAQGLTVAVVIISLAFETRDSSKGKGRWETVKILDPNDPKHEHLIEKQIHHESYAGEDQWRDMVEAEEERMKEREDAKKSVGRGHKKDSGNGNGNGNGNGDGKKQRSEKSRQAETTKGDGGTQEKKDAPQ